MAFKQWGYSDNLTVTFPISFNTIFMAIGMLVDTSKHEIAMNKPTNTGFKMQAYNMPVYWFAIGK